MADEVRYQVHDGVAVITLNRPERLNAWTPPMQVQYFDFLAEASISRDVAAVVLTGAGRGFCPGADMQYLSGLGGGSDGGSRPEDPRPMTFPLSVPKPMIAAVNGACAGLGLVHALMCDLRFAAAGAKWTTAFARRGLVAEHGVSWLLPRMVGTARALDLLLSGRVFTSEEAYQLGLANQVLPAAEVLPAAIAYARDLATNCSPASMAAIKRQVYVDVTVDLEPARLEGNRLMAISLKGPDFKEGVASYIAKRPPAFAPLGEGTVL
jgi:enoyl-CoA hydratase/carnithine racemase